MYTIPMGHMGWVKKMWKIVGVLALLVICAVAIRFLFKALIPGDIFSGLRPPVGIINTASRPRVVPKTITQETSLYTIHAAYPETTLGTVSLDGKTLIQNEIAQFVYDNNLGEMVASGQSFDGSQKYTLDISYREARSQKYLTYVYEISSYTLGAHPNNRMVTFTYDNDGKRMRLADFFKPNTSYLARLSAIARSELLGRTGMSELEEQILSGTEPIIDHFNTFIIKDTSIEIIFQPYQVGPYAMGAPSVTISFVELADIMR